MNFAELSDERKKVFTDLMFTPLTSATAMRDWIRIFLDLEIPIEITDPDSTSAPLDAIWQIYKTFKENRGDETPGAILLSCREGMKTVSVSILEILLLLHFQLDIAHAAATETQSSVGIKYIENFFFKIEGFVLHRGWENLTQNKRTIQYKTPEGKTPFIKVLICTPKGMNSLHANCLFLDELDLADPEALKEARNIVGYSKGVFGMTVFLSTRKYSFGNMQEALDRADEMHYKVFRWNILDVTERCPASRHMPDQPKGDRYIATRLPLQNLSKEEYANLPPTEQGKYELIKDAYAGCAKCPLLPVCKMRLSQKPEKATGGFYKPISSVIQKFRENDVDTAEAQILCWKPGSEGLVYPRFSKSLINGNVLDVKEAYNSITGERRTQVTDDMLFQTILSLGIETYAGVDWGFSHDTVIAVVAKMPNDEIWLLDCFASPGLEFSDVLETALKFKERFRPSKWYVDQAMPSHMKSFNKNGMRSPSFVKDVIGGIEALRSKILSANGKRQFKIINTANNKKVIDAIAKHRFVLDSMGNVTVKPDDEAGVADICFVPGTLIYTRDGTKPIETISCSDYVLTHTGQFKRVNGTSSRQYSGDIVSVNANTKPIVRCTPNHPFLIGQAIRSNAVENGKQLTGQRRIPSVFEFKPISEVNVPIGKKRKTDPLPMVVFPRIDLKKDPIFIDFKKYRPFWKESGDFLESNNAQSAALNLKITKIRRKVEISPNIAFTIGYYVAEGARSGNCAGISFAGHTKEKNVLQILEAACSEMGINSPIWRQYSKNSRGIVITNSCLFQFFKTLGAEKNKKFPDFVHELPRESMLALVAGYLFGDGCFKEKEAKSNSVSANISFTVYAMLVQLGCRPTIALAKRAGRWVGLSDSGVITSDMWVVGLGMDDVVHLKDEFYQNPLLKHVFEDKPIKTRSAEQASYRSIKTEYGLASSIMDIQYEPYEGLVYNLSVDDDQSYVANMMTVHNCDSLRYIGQNLFPVKGPQKPSYTQINSRTSADLAAIDQSTPEGKAKAQELMEKAKKESEHSNQMRAEIQRLLGDGEHQITTSKKGGFFFST